jgi:hypothetical protein
MLPNPRLIHCRGALALPFAKEMLFTQLLQ